MSGRGFLMGLSAGFGLAGMAGILAHIPPVACCIVGIAIFAWLWFTEDSPPDPIDDEFGGDE